MFMYIYKVTTNSVKEEVVKIVNISFLDFYMEHEIRTVKGEGYGVAEVNCCPIESFFNTGSFVFYSFVKLSGFSKEKLRDFVKRRYLNDVLFV